MKRHSQLSRDRIIYTVQRCKVSAWNKQRLRNCSHHLVSLWRGHNNRRMCCCIRGKAGSGSIASTLRPPLDTHVRTGGCLGVVRYNYRAVAFHNQRFGVQRDHFQPAFGCQLHQAIVTEDRGCKHSHGVPFVLHEQLHRRKHLHLNH